MKTNPNHFSYNQIIGFVIIGISIVILGFVSYSNSVKSKLPIVFSEKYLLSNTWKNYKDAYIDPESGRTIDTQQDNITTSEGQSYSMLRAVWMDDRETFDKVFKFSQEILKHKNDNLYSWLFGKSANGTYKVLTDRGGDNAATDADTDIALALIFAYKKWDDGYYLQEAKLIINDIWKNEIVFVKGNPIVAANDIEKSSPSKIIVNPSYLAPYAYKIFATVDKEHDWNKVADYSYVLIEESIKNQLNTGTTTANIPPDWIQVDRNTGAIQLTTLNNLTTNYSYDALRLPWRMGLDYEWFKDERAKNILDKLSFFKNEWQTKRMIAVSYKHNGEVIENIESPAMYGGIIGYFMVSEPTLAEEVYKEKLQILYNPDDNFWRKKLSYYDDNWAWFGIALYNHLLPNLAK